MLTDELDEIESGISNLSAFKNLQTMFQQREKESLLKTLTSSPTRREHTPFGILKHANEHQKLSMTRRFGTENSRFGSITSIDALSCAAGSSLGGVGGSISTTIMDKCFGNNSNYLYCSAVVER